jgi:hypothetical protein
MSILRRQVFRRDFVEIVAAVVAGMGAKQTASTPEVYGGQNDSVAGSHVLRGQKPVGEQACTPICEVIDRAQSADTRGRPRSCHDSAHTTLIEYIRDFPVRVGIDESVDLFDDLGIGSAQFHARLRQRQIERPCGAADKAYIHMKCIALGERDVFDQQPEHALFLLHLRARIAPETREIGGERHQFCTLGLGHNARIGGLCFLVGLLCRGQGAQFLVPVRLQRVSYQAVIGIKCY